ncbi:MAG: type I-B CRISPR-associated protein Cas7/Cst2/DevR [Nitrospirae bacterium]|nr:type I-B CRISPR-associated protein Cas7/Cst2/DevR [Nitrospirota bacterium]
MSNTGNLTPSKGLAITYLVRLSIGSPSGGRSEIENLNVIKKIREGFFDFPYASSQAMKRALRETLKGLGYEISPIVNTSPARTVGDPIKYIDDDLFGFMEAASKKSGRAEIDKFNGIRKAVVSMTPLLSLSAFDDNVDFGSNMMGLQAGGNPMPYETEVHRGWYRVSLYIDVNRIGTDAGFITGLDEKKRADDVNELIKNCSEKYDFIAEVPEDKDKNLKKGYAALKKICTNELSKEDRYKRSKALLNAIRFLAPSGRSSNWLIDLTPKLMAAAFVKGARTPFLESPLLDDKQRDKNVINLDAIKTAKETFADGIENLVVGYREDLIEKPTVQENAINVQKMKAAFDTIDRWLKEHFGIVDQ